MVRGAVLVVTSAVLLLVVAALSRTLYDPPGGDEGVLRLSWRFRGERVEACRQRTEAELAALPAHMRTPEVCSGRLAAYRVIVRIDDAPADTARVLPGGARGDRPIFVLRDTRLEPGTRRLRVWFGPDEANEDDTGGHEGGGRAVSAGDRTDGVAVGNGVLHLDVTVLARPGAVHLVTIDPSGPRLVHRTSGR
jgi:hypothetical protein